MRPEDIHVGDRLRVREWDDMAAEFGTSADGTVIFCEYGFTDIMRRMCGQPFTVSRIHDNCFSSEEGTEAAKGVGHYRGEWSVSAGMLEPYDSPEYENLADPVGNDGLSEFLGI